jgi:hypothetical protein
VILKRRSSFVRLVRQRCVTNAKTIGTERKLVSRTMMKNIKDWILQGAQCAKFRLSETKDAIK